MDTIAISHQPVDGVDVRVAKSDGDRDENVPPVNAEYLHERLPNSKLHQFDAGHFFWEDAGGEFAALASAWVGGQYRDVG